MHRAWLKGIDYRPTTEITMEYGEKHSDDSDSLRVVLLGPTSSGKSSTANSILGTEAFEESPTIACSAQQGEFQGRDIWVIDTPGLSESAEVKREIQRSPTLGPPAPTVFLFIVDLTKITEREWSQYLKMVEEIFGNNVLIHVMVLFTQRDKFTKTGFQKLLSSAEIQDLVRRCGGSHAMYSKEEVNPSQVEKLIKHIEAMMTTNGTQPVKNQGRHTPELSKTEDVKVIPKNTVMTRDVFKDVVSSDFVTTERLTKGCIGGCQVSDHLDRDNQTLNKELGKGWQAGQTEEEKQNKQEESATNEMQREAVEEMRKREATERWEDTSKDKGNLEATSTGTLCGGEGNMMKPSRLQHTKNPSLKIVLLGPTGSGKTSTANGILGRKGFPGSPTTVCNAQHGESNGRDIWVIDTPGLKESDEVKQEIKGSLNLGPPAPTVLLFVIEQNKQDSGKWEFYMKLIEEVFGKAAMRHVMILFTQNETLGNVDYDIMNSLDTQNLLRRCNGWYHIISKTEIAESQVEELLRKMRMMMVSEADLRIVLLGKTGAGKSSSGNTILGEAVFNSDFCVDSVTATCQRVFGEVGGRSISLVDTPGLFDTKKSVDVVKEEIEKCVDLSVPGPHVFLVVMRLDVRFTDEERDAVKWIKDNFGEGAAKFTMVLFTHADQLRGKLADEMLKGDLKTLIDSCSGYHVFNNEVKDDKTQVKELLEKIDNMVEKNGGKCYTNEMYQEAQRKLRETALTLKGIAGGAAAGAALGLATGFVPGALVGAAAGAVAGGGGAALTFFATKVSNHPEAESCPSLANSGENPEK